MISDFKVLARNFGAALLGWLASVVVVIATMSAAWFVMGADGTFLPGSWEVSPSWVFTTIVFGVAAGVCGGYLCAKVAADGRGILVLVGVIVVLGIVSALPEPATIVAGRPDEVGLAEAMRSAQQPRWLAWLNPVIGVTGVLFGARLFRRSQLS